MQNSMFSTTESSSQMREKKLSASPKSKKKSLGGFEATIESSNPNNVAHGSFTP